MKIVSFILILLYLESCNSNPTSNTDKKIEEKSRIKTDSITSNEFKYAIQYRNKITRFIEEKNYIIYWDSLILYNSEKDTISCDSLIFDSKDSLISIPGKFKIKSGSRVLDGEDGLWDINKKSFRIKKVNGTVNFE